MSKLDNAKFLARISWKLEESGTSKKKLGSEQAWVDFYMTFSESELMDDMRQYIC